MFQACQQPFTGDIAITDINVVDVNTGAIIPSQTILIRGELIDTIMDYSADTKLSIKNKIDGKGKYLIPGLFDMHMHIAETENSIAELDRLLMNGITGIRDMGGMADTIARAKDMIRRGQIMGPEIYFAGVTLDGPQTLDPFHYKVHDSTDLQQLTGHFKNLGVDFFKVHNFFPMDRLIELKKAANESGLEIIGHIPRGIGPMELDSVGIKGVEHMNSLISSLVFEESNNVDNITEAFAILDSTYISGLSNYYRENQISWTPTLYTLEDYYSNFEDDESRAMGMRMMELFYTITHWMNQNDVMLLAGSDMGPVNDSTLDVLHKELEMLVKSGLSPWEALKTATINPAKFLKIDKEYGSIKVFKKASLIILNSNPLEDISNTTDISAVLKDGVVFN